MKKKLLAVCVLGGLVLGGCATPRLPVTKLIDPSVDATGNYVYRIGVGDVISVFVWGNPDISGDYSIRPDGRVSMALTDELLATGKTTDQLKGELEILLSEYIKDPKVSVLVRQAQGTMMEQVKVVGESINPAALPYTKGMTLLDLMIRIGGLSPYADGNDAILIRVVNGKAIEYPVRLEDLMIDADLTANTDLMPGDIIRISEAWF